MTAAKRIFEACERLGVSKHQLAKRAGLSSGYLTHLEHGLDSSEPRSPQHIKEPTLGTIEKISRALGISTAWLALGEGDEPNWDEIRRGAA